MNQHRGHIIPATFGIGQMDQGRHALGQLGVFAQQAGHTGIIHHVGQAVRAHQIKIARLDRVNLDFKGQSGFNAQRPGQQVAARGMRGQGAG